MNLILICSKLKEIQSLTFALDSKQFITRDMGKFNLCQEEIIQSYHRQDGREVCVWFYSGTCATLDIFKAISGDSIMKVSVKLRSYYYFVMHLI